MTVLQPADDELHYPDSTHRWMYPYSEGEPAALDAWSTRVRAHLAAHQSAVESNRAGLADRLGSTV